MNSKVVQIITILLVVTHQVTVTQKDQCDNCNLFKSSSDCIRFRCIWKETTSENSEQCVKPQDPPDPPTNISFCSTIQSPQTCSKTIGCAYLDGQCINFPGCSAFQKTTTTDCQNISFLCISDGVQCINVKECKDYTMEQCSTSISPRSPFKCKLDGQTCRDMKCIEADTTLKTDQACNDWLSGCKTTGMGCIDILPSCVTYQGTATTCQNMRGIEGICDFDTNTGKCKGRICTNALSTLKNDTECNQYKPRCVTTGKGCIDILKGCSSYQGNTQTCEGYVGTDGLCTGDENGTQCRQRECKDKQSNSNQDCNTWKSGCVTNGKYCLPTLLNCYQYRGTSVTCLEFFGIDGNCKGTGSSDTPCSPKDCVTDSQGTETTDIECQAIQTKCKSTGKGCVETLLSCTSYTYTDDGSSCNSLIGSEGKCKAGTNGKCDFIKCEDAETSLTTHQQCNDYSPGCISNGAGCLPQQICQDVSKQMICEGSKNNNCVWNSFCVSNATCDNFKNQSLCNQHKANNKPCKWVNGSCTEALCSDLKGETDQACQSQLSSCYSNGTDCLDFTDCSLFKGTQTSCQSKPKCTNDSGADQPTTQCKPRTCDDPYLTYTTDLLCNSYLQDCVTKGTGCIHKSKGCDQYTGTQSECKKFKGDDGTKECGSSSTLTPGPCQNKICTHATNMSNDTGCKQFMNDCIYDGNGSCVDKSSPCTAFTGDATSCLNFKGVNGTVLCSKGTNGKCKNRVCADNTTATTHEECDTFLSGCVTKKNGCKDGSISCALGYTGSFNLCKQFVGNKKQCTQKEQCKSQSIGCSGKTDANNNNDCILYHPKCRIEQGKANCIDAPNTCDGFTSFKNDATLANKHEYCNIVLTLTGDKCSYNDSNGKCGVRSCELWHSSITAVTCQNYMGTSSCNKDVDNKCYTPDQCSNYTIPSGKSLDQEKLTWCEGQYEKGSSTIYCTYDSNSSTTKCADVTKCEQIKSPQDAGDCNSYLKTTNCQFFDNKCLTTKETCQGYSLTGIQDQTNYCKALKSKSSSGDINICKYDSNTSNNCVDSIIAPLTACNQILNPQSQGDCDQVSNCIFYYNECFPKQVCTEYPQINPGPNVSQQIYCQTMRDKNTNRYCSYNSSNGMCDQPKQCGQYVGNTNTICQQRTNEDNLRCYFNFELSQTMCSTPGDAYSACNSPGNNQISCELYGYHFCYSDGTSCYPVMSCEEHDVTNYTNKIGACKYKFLWSQLENCTWEDGNYCIAKKICSEYRAPSGDEFNFCNQQVDINGAQCTWLEGNYCRSKSCLLHPSPKSQVDCDILSTGCIYFYTEQKCYAKQANCTGYSVTGIGTTDEDKLKFCQSMKEVNDTQCTFILSKNTCVNKGACSTYDVSAISSSTDKVSACQAIDTSDSTGCTYFGSGNNCIQVTTCANYTGGSSSDCSSLKSSDQVKCTAATGANSSTACQDLTLTLTCETIQSPTSQEDCDNSLSGCVFYNNNCYTGKSDCAYTVVGSDAEAFCNGIKNTDGDFCAVSSSSSTCQQRTCSDTVTSQYKTNQECKDYKSTCKLSSTRLGCIDKSNSCNSFVVNPSFCALFLDTDNQTSCIADPSPSTSGACIDLDCSDNDYSDTDDKCKAYHPGCLTKGTGCISKTAPCSDYQGTSSTCLNFTGNGIKCWSDSSSEAACRDRLCSDKASASNQSDCDSFLADCKFNGTKCITKDKDCTAYSGNQSQCSQFSGIDGTIPCWGASTSVSAACTVRKCYDKLNPTNQQDCDNFLPGCKYMANKCILGSDPCSAFEGTQDQCKQLKGLDNTQNCWGASTTVSAACKSRECSDLTGTTDSDCNNFMPPSGTQTTPICITDGTKCVDNDKPCSYFSGNDNSCSKFTSTQGKCKASLVSSSSVPCTPRVCHEAPINYNTDQQCESYQKDCKTTGRGCTDISKCQEIETQQICSNRSGCLWAPQCSSQLTQCSDYTSLGQTICANSVQINGIQCSWQNQICKPAECKDYNQTLNKHSDCQAKDITCTTSGAGCVTLGKCSSYNTPQVCGAANTTEVSIRCTWSSGQCRQRECKDGIFSTDAECSTFLNGCKSSGRACIGPFYECKVFDGFQQNCVKDSSGQKCSYANEKCFIFKQCTDVPSTSLTVCQKFSQYCVPGINSCQSISTCDKYESQEICTIGLNNTTCGWNPIGKCAIFNSCKEAEGTNLYDCQNWNPICLSDGTRCIEKSICSNYQTTSACENQGIDGVCQWTGTTCRLRNCSDTSAKTDTDCQAVQVSSGICTTDGTKCVERAECSSYQEAGCTIGRDGIPCIFGYPSGTTSGTKLCRQIECTDVQGATNYICLNQIATTKCVFNGVSCIKQDTCDKYKTKLSCRGGGSDGLCVFTSVPTETDPNAGKCQLFKSCETAKNDKDACALKPTQCKWSETTSGTTISTKCQPIDCSLNAEGTKCNPVPSFDGQTYTICVLVNGVCSVGDPSKIAQDQCYLSTYYTYTWNQSIGKCVPCKISTSLNNTETNQSNQNETIKTDFSNVLRMSILSIIGFFL